jgi:hypothetical protein
MRHNSVARGIQASQAAAQMPYMSAGSSAPAAAGPTKVINVENHYSQPPPDPHTFSKSIEFELGAG